MCRIRQGIEDTTEKRWQDRWEQSPNAGAVKQLSRIFNVGYTLKLHEGLSRRQSATLVHARTEHIRFNGHLHRLGMRDSPQCACGYHRESREHVLKGCPRWNVQRQELYGLLPLYRRLVGRMLGSKDGEVTRCAVRLVQARLDSWTQA